ncbi:MAG: hypothetical protein Q9170_000860 [Blastenia crenularia]
MSRHPGPPGGGHGGRPTGGSGNPGGGHGGRPGSGRSRHPGGGRSGHSQGMRDSYGDPGDDDMMDGPPPGAGRDRGRGRGQGAGGGTRELVRHGGGPHGGQPEYGPWHQVLFAIAGGEFACQGSGDHGPGGRCDKNMRAVMMENAKEFGYQGHPNPRAVEDFLLPHAQEIMDGMHQYAAESLGVEITMPQGGGGRAGLRDLRGDGRLEGIDLGAQGGGHGGGHVGGGHERRQGRRHRGGYGGGYGAGYGGGYGGGRYPNEMGPGMYYGY